MSSGFFMYKMQDDVNHVSKKMALIIFAPAKEILFTLKVSLKFQQLWLYYTTVSLRKS